MGAFRSRKLLAHAAQVDVPFPDLVLVTEDLEQGYGISLVRELRQRTTTTIGEAVGTSAVPCVAGMHLFVVPAPRNPGGGA